MLSLQTSIQASPHPHISTDHISGPISPENVPVQIEVQKGETLVD